jgi:hypothetical protein
LFWIHHLILVYWGLRFVICSTFLFTGLSRSHISDSELVKLTQIDLDFFFSMFFFMKLIFVFFIFSHQIIGTWALWFFLLFFLWGYPECGLVQWTSVNSIFFSAFFYLTSVFFARLFFFKSSFFFITISYHGWQVNRVNPGWHEFFFIPISYHGWQVNRVNPGWHEFFSLLL